MLKLYQALVKFISGSITFSMEIMQTFFRCSAPLIVVAFRLLNANKVQRTEILVSLVRHSGALHLTCFYCLLCYKYLAALPLSGIEILVCLM